MSGPNRSWTVFFAHWIVCYLGCIIAGIGGALMNHAIWGGAYDVTLFDMIWRWQIGSLGAFLMLMGVTFALPSAGDEKSERARK